MFIFEPEFNFYIRFLLACIYSQKHGSIVPKEYFVLKILK